jgi:hypothetical protein
MTRAMAIVDSGVVVNLIVADAWPGGIDVTDLTPRPGPGWTYDGQVFAPPSPVEPVTATTPRMTHYGFLARLTLPEHVAIEEAMPANPILRVAKQRFDAADHVDVSLVETQQFVGLLGHLGLVAPTRVSGLLAEIEVTSRHAVA